MQIETRQIEALKEDPRNARKHDGRNVEAIKESLKEFGQQKPIVIDGEGQIIAGHGTVQAAQELEWQQIEVVVSNLSEMKKAAFAIADNRTAELATWNEEELAKTLEWLSEETFDLAEHTGFGKDEINRLLERTAEETLDEAPDWANSTDGDVDAGVNKIMLTFTTEELERWNAAIEMIREEHDITDTTSAVIKAVEELSGHAIAGS